MSVKPWIELNCYQLDHTFINSNSSQLTQKSQWQSVRPDVKKLVEYLKDQVQK